MAKIKVLELLKSLTDDEFRLLDKFVRSPVHNRHADVIELFLYFRKALKKSPDSISVESMFSNVFPKLEFDAQKIHHVSSYLVKVIEAFLAWNEWRKDENNVKLKLLEAQHRLQLTSEFGKNLKKYQSNMNSINRIDSGHARDQFQLELMRFEHDRLVNSTSKVKFNLQEVSNKQDIAIIAEKLRIACIMLSNQAVVNTNYETGLLENILDYVEEKKLTDSPAIAVYYYAIQTIRQVEDDTSFAKLKKLLASHQKSFNIKELHDIYLFAINYCIRRFNSGEQQFMKEVFDIYKLGMGAKAFLQNGVMSPRTYSNVVMSGLRAKDHNWVEKFIFNYKEALPEKQREGFFNYNLARFYYDKSNFDKAMPLLQMMDYEDVLLTCLGKILLAKMQFELKEWDLLYNHLQSFNAYLRRKKMLGYHKETFFNFIKSIQKIMSLKIDSLEALFTDIKNLNVAEKEWLLNQVRSLS